MNVQGPSFLSSFSDCILDNIVGVCDIQLIQYDAAALALRTQSCSSSTPSSSCSLHSLLNTQKHLYNQLRPQKCTITQCHALLTGRYALAYDSADLNTSSVSTPQHSFDLVVSANDSIHISSYDLSCSFALSSPYKYALVLSRPHHNQDPLQSIYSDGVLESVFDLHGAELPWLTRPAETESMVVLFNQKRKRKLWKRCLKDIFGFSTVNVHKALEYKGRRRDSFVSAVSIDTLASSGGYRKYQKLMKEPAPPVPEMPPQFAQPIVPVRSINRKKAPIILDTEEGNNGLQLPSRNRGKQDQGLEIDQLMQVALMEEAGKGYRWKWEQQQNDHINDIQNLISGYRVGQMTSTSKPRVKDVVAVLKHAAAPVARQSRTVSQITLSLPVASPKPASKPVSKPTPQSAANPTPKPTHNVAPKPVHSPTPKTVQNPTPKPVHNPASKPPHIPIPKPPHIMVPEPAPFKPSMKLFTANVTPPLDDLPLDMPPADDALTATTSLESDKRHYRGKLSMLLGRDRPNVEQRGLSVSSITSGSTSNSNRSSSSSNSSYQSSTSSTSSSNSSSKSPYFAGTANNIGTFQTLESWVLCQNPALSPFQPPPHLMADSAKSKFKNKNKNNIQINTSIINNYSNNSHIGSPTASSNSPSSLGLLSNSEQDVAGALNIIHCAVPRWHALSTPTSPLPPKIKLPEIPEVPERVS